MKRYAERMARLDALEARFLPRMRAALIRSAEAAADSIASGASPAVAAALVKPAFLVAVLEDLYEQGGLAEAQEEYDYLTTAYPRKALPGVALIADWTSRLRRFITTEGATSIRAITEATRSIIRRVLTDAADRGLGVAEAARELRSQVATLSVERSISIVRTELIAASNQGSLLGAQATGLKLQKVWLATPGPRTRPTHREANGQATTMEGWFTVGDARGRYPGDPLLPAGERVRCRCTVTYRPLE